MRNYQVVKFRKLWHVIWKDTEGKRRRISLGTADRHLADERAPEVIALSRRDAKRVYTVQMLLEMYLDQSEAIGLDILKFHAKPLIAALGQCLAQDVGDEVRTYTSERRKVVKPGTIRKELGLLRAAVNWAERSGYLERAPFVKLPPSPPPRDKRLTVDETDRLVAACEQPHLILFVMIARYTAARAGAILSLRWDQVDFDARQIDLGGAGRQKRRAVVHMTRSLAFPLAIAKSVAMSPYVVEYAGRRVASVKKGFAAACERAGLEGCTPHVMRHTAASLMAEKGISMHAIAQYLGHSNPSITARVYARFSPGYLKMAGEALE